MSYLNRLIELTQLVSLVNKAIIIQRVFFYIVCHVFDTLNAKLLLPTFDP